jgi:phosphoribosylanthranilate isomerase
MLSTKIYAGPITNLTDARYFAAWDVAWMSFNLSPGEDSFLPINQVQAIKEWVEGPAMVGAFNLHSAEEIQKLAVDLQLDAIKLGMETELSTLLELDTELPIIKEITVGKDNSCEHLENLLSDFAPKTSYFILNFAQAAWSYTELQEAKELNWSYLHKLSQHYPIIFNLGFGAEPILDMLENSQAVGIQVTGGAEEKVGYKSFDELDEIFEALEDI